VQLGQKKLPQIEVNAGVVLIGCLCDDAVQFPQFIVPGIVQVFTDNKRRDGDQKISTGQEQTSQFAVVISEILKIPGPGLSPEGFDDWVDPGCFDQDVIDSNPEEGDVEWRVERELFQPLQKTDDGVSAFSVVEEGFVGKFVLQKIDVGSPRKTFGQAVSKKGDPQRPRI